MPSKIPRRPRLGRPARGEARPQLRSITVRLDPETVELLAKLERAVGRSVLRGRRSQVVRQAIHDAAGRLPTSVKA